MRRAATTTLALAALLVAPCVATAATVQVVPMQAPGPGGPTGKLVVLAAPDERNLITLGQAGSEIVVVDAGAPLTARAGCVQRAAREVRCSARLFEATRAVSVDLGDRDDRIEAAGFGTRFSAAGGPGSDVLLGAPVGAELDGGPGEDMVIGNAGGDTLAGGGGRDSLAGGAGDDFLLESDEGGAPASDVVDGGPGRDSVTYLLRARPLTIDLAAGRGGEAGEADTLRAIESVEGGKASDRIIGDAGPNELDGGGGHNVLVGLGGADLLREAHLSDAGAGDDRIENSRRAVCGLGRDRVEPLLDRDEVALDCEAITPFELRKERLRVSAPRGAMRAPIVRLRSRCEREAGRRGCRATVRVHAATSRRRLGRRSPLIGAATLRVRRSRRMALNVRPTRRARRLLRRHPDAFLLVRVRLREAASSGFNGDHRAGSVVVPLSGRVRQSP